MSLADQARDLASQGAAMRQETFGVDQDGSVQMFEGDDPVNPIPCYFTPVRDTQQLESAGMKEVHDCIVRINKLTGFEPRMGQTIKLLNARNGGGDLTVKFKEFGHTAINPEFVIGCENIF